MVQGWYQGGVSVFDFTDSAHPVEIAYFDRGPYDATELVTAGYWSTYWYNGFVYGSEIARGLDIFRLTPSPYLSQAEIEAAALVEYAAFNAQEQPVVEWPDSPVVARAYLDQLVRGLDVSASRAESIRRAIEQPDAAINEALAEALEASAESASGPTAERLAALARLLRTFAGN
jgi:hypothetical protein